MSDDAQRSRVPGNSVQHLPGQQRYLYLVDGDQVALADYWIEAGLLHLSHTEIDPVLRGSGLVERMVQQVLDEIRAHTDFRVIPDCPLVAAFIERNPAYRELTLSGV